MIRVTFKCIDGGHGWGSTGSMVKMIFTKPHDDEYYLSFAPGGWVIYEKECIDD